MTDRINTITIVLERDVRDDDIEPLVQALQMIRGVAAVKPNVAHVSDFMAEERAKRDMGHRILDAITKIVYPSKEQR